MVNTLHLQQGDEIEGFAQASSTADGMVVTEIALVNSQAADRTRPAAVPFEDRKSVTPHERIRLETADGPITTRVVDLLTPVGKGQRALIVAPPRTGKTTLLQHAAQAIATNYPEMHLAILLVDERPEEVTEFRDGISAEYFTSNLDQPFANHVRMANLAIGRCKRLAEAGRDVVLVIDSLTRLARAYNKTISNGPIAQSGLRIRALEFPKSIFGAARAFDEGGSLTVIATALVGTNSQMDDAIFQEFKGTGNLEIVLESSLADRNVWPAMNLSASRTRNESKLYSADELQAALAIRHTLPSDDKLDAMTRLTRQLDKFASNRELMQLVNAAASQNGIARA